MSKLRVAVIGVGFFAVNQLNAWRDIDEVEIAAICDTRPERLAEIAGQFGIAGRYTDASAMLASEKLDFVDIAATPASHRALVELAAAHRLPVICQKPFAPSLEDAGAMVDCCERAGVALMVHENFRWQSPMRAVEEVVRSDRIGRPFWGRISFRSGFDIYSPQPYLGTVQRFIVADLGIHLLDLARFFLGDVGALSARTQRINPDIRGEDVATILLTHERGAVSVVECSYASRPAMEPFPQTSVEIEGEAGSVRLDTGYRLTVVDAAGTHHSDVSPPLLAWAERPWHNVQESVLNIQRHWVDCLIRGVEPATSGRDNLKTLALVEAAYQSAATGKTVAFSER